MYSKSLYCVLLLATCMGAWAGECASTDPTLFGMTLNKFTTPWPPASKWGPLPFKTLRLWDSTTDWARIHTGAQSYNWSKLDDWVSRAASQGVDVLYTIGHTPNWATTKPPSWTISPSCSGSANGLTYSCLPPKDLNSDGTGTNATWKAFVTALALRNRDVYKGRIKAYELWNEFDAKNFWRGTNAQLLRMAADAYLILKSVDPAALVLTPSVTAKNPGTLDLYLAAGGAAYADLVAFHGRSQAPANASPESVVGVVNTFRALLTKYGSGKCLWDTEGGWRPNEVTGGNQPAFVARQYILLAGSRVGRYYWYQWDNPAGWGTMLSSYGTPTSAATAYAIVSKWLVGAEFSSPCAVDSNGTTWRCSVQRPGYSGLLIWNTTGGKAFYSSSSYIQYRNLNGAVRPIKPGTYVTIGTQPLLLETGSVF